MKKFARKMQQLGEKAAQVQRAIDAAPAKAAQIRESVMATAAQIQQLRADVLSSVSSMRSTDDARLVDAIRELGNAGPALAEAGFEIESVELEMGIQQRLIVQLARVAEVPAARLRGLRDMQWESPALQSILGAILTAQELASRVDGGSLQFSRITAYVGASPSVRIAWEPVETAAPVVAVPPPVAAKPEPAVVAPVPSPAAPPAAASSFGSYGASSFFEPRQTPVQARPASGTAGTESAAVVPSSGKAKEETSEDAESSGDWRKDALARFKKMPDLSRRSGR